MYPSSDLRAFMDFAGNDRDLQVVLDRSGTIVGVSDSIRSLLGFEPREAVGLQFGSLIPDEDQHAYELLMQSVHDLVSIATATEFRIVHADGTHQWFEIQPKLVFKHNVIVLTARDSSAHLSLVQRLESQENRFRATAEAAPLSILRIDSNGDCEYVNRRWTELTGQSFTDALGFGAYERFHRTQLEGHIDHIKTTANGSVDIDIFSTDGQRHHTVLRWNRLFDAMGRDDGVVIVVEDLTDRKELERRLSHQVRHDALTGLPNRLVLKDALTTALGQSGDQVPVLLFCDLDRFKLVNDSVGHGAGDRLLVAVGRRLSLAFGETATVARFGGDEFVILAEVANEAAAVAFGHRVTRLFEQPFDLGIGRPYLCSASVGVAIAGPGSTAESLLRDADSAMYLAKDGGRGRAATYDDRVRIQALNRLALEADLRTAIINGDLFVEYQPIVEPRTRSIRSVEALVRWNHPVRGRVGPNDFIMIAEECGLLPAMTEWVIEQACHDLEALPGVSLNVNLSAGQVSDPRFVDRLISLISRTGFDPTRLVVEITESMLVADADGALTILQDLRNRGIRIAIDDFGTGFSSLSYLAKFPVDSLKIDRSFVSGLLDDLNSREIVRAVVALAHALGLTATAEGVETEEQRALLILGGCDAMQGYLFSRPVAIEEVKAMHLRSLIASGAIG
jgi:diguanylate cyclase (GGDEF)-like protein/PAS domain S-box-containing protein